MLMNITVLKNWLASRARKRPPTTIVFHATDGASALSSISWLRQIGFSYHYVIGADGVVYKCVRLSRVAFHAGKSFGPEGANVNDYSIGIAFDCWDSRGELITDAQIEAAINLCKAIKGDMNTLTWVTTHYAVSPGRKTDPATMTRSQGKRILDGLPWAKNFGVRTYWKIDQTKDAVMGFSDGDQPRATSMQSDGEENKCVEKGQRIV